jgi:hypothetical protein
LKTNDYEGVRDRDYWEANTDYDADSHRWDFGAENGREHCNHDYGRNKMVP